MVAPFQEALLNGTAFAVHVGQYSVMETKF